MIKDSKNCPICGSAVAFAFQVHKHSIHRCQNRRCGHLFDADARSNMGVETPETASRDDVDIQKVFSKRNHHLVRYWQRKGFLKKGFRLLDVGAGFGHIIDAVRQELDVEIDCVEPGTGFHEALSKMNVGVYHSIGDIPDDRYYDACLLVEVIDHLDNPVEILKQIKRRLKPSGQLFVTAAAGDLKRPIPAPWELGGYQRPDHVQFFTATSLCYALRAAGFSRLRYRYVMELYPDAEKTDTCYESNWAKRYALLQQIRFWREGARHLSFFAQ